MSAEAASGTSIHFPEEQVREQLQKIFLCPAFSVSDILRRFLTYIIDETLAGKSNMIKEYTIAVNVLNKPISFKPQHDAIVRIHAGRLRRALNYYYKEQGVEDAIEITVPKGSYVPVFGNMQAIESITESNLKRISPQSFSEVVTMVIMPFRTFEMDISRQAFADSLGQQLSAEFGRFSDFSVISYYTTQQLSSKDREIQELAFHFGAQYVVTGNVQFETRRLRVAVQLIDTNTGTQIWSELYVRNHTTANLFEVADNIVTDVIAVLGDFNGVIMQQMSRGLTRSKSGKSAISTFSLFNEFYTRFNEEGFKKVYAAMDCAVKENPLNDTAWAFLGELYLQAFLFNQSIGNNPQAEALNCARMALKINPLSQFGHMAMGMVNIFYKNKQASLDSLEYALILNRNASGSMGMIGCLMIQAGEYNRGIELINKSIERNKSYPPYFNLFISIYYFRQKEFSLAWLQAEKMAMPDLALNILLQASILFHMGRKSESSGLIKKLMENIHNRAGIFKENIHGFFLDQDLIEQLYKCFKSVKTPLLTVA